MPLEASCDALYFPDQPSDNIIGLRWVEDGGKEASSLEPNTTLIFKVKSTAPALFHVRPHYGALLLADPTAIVTPAYFQSTSVQFGLRNGNGDSSIARASPDRDTASVSTTRKQNGEPSGRHRERFVVDYAVVKCEPLVYRQVAQAFHDTTKLTEVVKSIWALISSGTIAASHIGLRGQVGLQVYMSNVHLNEAAAKAAGVNGNGDKPVVVPAQAKLVPSTLGDRASISVGRSPQGGGLLSPNSASASSGVGTSPPKKGDALRTLKEEVKALRQEVYTPQDGNSCNVTPTNNASRSPLPTTPDAAAARKRLVMNQSGLSDPDDILMKVNFDPTAAAASSSAGGTKKKGVKLYLLLIMMFVVYLLCMLMRRGGEIEALVAGGKDGSNAAVVLSRPDRGGKTGRHGTPKKLPAAGQPSGVTSLDL